MFIRLTWNDPTSGQAEDKTLPVPVTIGRDPNANSLVISHESISRQHAEITEVSGSLRLQDKGSFNGIIVNGEKVQQVTLSPGMSVELGSVRLNIVSIEHPDVTGSRTVAISAATDSDKTVELDASELPPLDPAPIPPPEPLPSNAPQVILRWIDPNSGQPQEQTAVPPISIGRNPGSTIVMQNPAVSRDHALIQLHGNQLMLIDQDSRSGTLLNGQQVQQAAINSGDTIQIVDVTFNVMSAQSGGGAEATQIFNPSDPPATLIFSEDTDQILPTAIFSAAQVQERRTFPPPIFDQQIVPMAALRQSGFPIEETTYLAIGGGIGSFVWVDHLLCYGADPNQIVSIGFEEKPYGRYRRLCKNSQIPDFERLRSNSDSCPDNIWGWPGYSVREIWQDLRKGNVGHAFKLAYQIFGEPTLYETYTPKAGNVFDSMDREADRINWKNIWRYGRVKSIRKTDDGRYVAAYSQSGQQGGSKYAIIVAPFVHVAIGYPALRFLRDLQEYREKTGDFKSVVNAYEPHEHVYEQLRRKGGTVLIRGRGIVSSRIIQRLYELRQDGANVGILHLNRTPLAEGARYLRAKRQIDNHWEFQPFNWPKAGWGGDLRLVLEQASDAERGKLLKQWGGTTTADRTDWRDIIRDGLREGWYEIEFGTVKSVDKQNGHVVTHIEKKNVSGTVDLLADFIIDGTGLEADVDSHPLLKDLIDTYGLRRNSSNRLFVSNDFGMVGMENGNGRMYSAGAMTLGGPYAPVDSFLGLQYAAMRSVDDLVHHGAPGLRFLNLFTSLAQWIKWARGVHP